MGLEKRYFLIGFGACALLMACAAFPYRNYNYDIKNHVLQADKPENDLSDSVCLPAGGNAFPCQIMLTDAFYAMKEDYLKTKQELIDCQKGNPPTAK